jgi:uncharacterized protein HemX
MARPASPSRRRRSPRNQAAGTLLAAATAVGLLVPVAAPASAAVVLPLVVAVCALAGGLLHVQVRRERAEHAADRLAQARAFTETSVARSGEHQAYVERVGAQVAGLQREVRELEGTLRLAEARGDEAEHRLGQERAQLLRAEIRVIELEVALERRRSEQIDELAEWPSDEVDTVVDLLNWEHRAEDDAAGSRSA